PTRDWSSDVCSSDLSPLRLRRASHNGHPPSRPHSETPSQKSGLSRTTHAATWCKSRGESRRNSATLWREPCRKQTGGAESADVWHAFHRRRRLRWVAPSSQRFSLLACWPRRVATPPARS